MQQCFDVLPAVKMSCGGDINSLIALPSRMQAIAQFEEMLMFCNARQALWHAGALVLSLYECANATSVVFLRRFLQFENKMMQHMF